MLLPALVLAQMLAGAQVQQAASVHAGRARQLAVSTPRLEAEVVIDGKLDEGPWRRAALLTGFSQFQPLDGVPAEDSTEVLVWYSPTAIHFGIRAHERHGPVNATLADRDRIGNDDHIQLFLGTFNDGRQATVIGVNPLGVQMDGTMLESNQRGRTGSFGTEAAREGADLSPDFVFQSKGRLTDYGYEVEIRVPFKSLRYQPQLTQTWGFNVTRVVQHLGGEDSWAPARRASASFLQQGGTLVGLTDLRRGLVLDLNPMVTQRTLGAERETGGWRYDRERPEVGGNVRWGITNDLVLNATVNPDFSQVESDAGQFSFDPRQAVYYSEKRPFFLEGSEQYATPSNLVYTRRIVQPEVATKLTGRYAGTNVAFLGAVDDRAGANSMFPSELAHGASPVFGILRATRDFGRRGRLGVTVTDRERGELYNRVGSLDGRLVFRQIYSASAQLAGSATRRVFGSGDTATAGPLWLATLARNGRTFGFNYNIRGIDPEFRTQSGFISRGNIVNASATHRFTRLGARGSLFESVSFDPRLDWTWKYRNFMRSGDAIEKKVHLNVNSTLRGGWTAGGGLLLETFGYDADIYRGYRVLRAPGDTVPFVGTPRLWNRDWLVSLNTPSFKSWNAGMFVLYGQDENFEEWSSGDIFWLNLNVGFRPTEKARIDLSYAQTTVDRSSDGTEVLNSAIPRAKLEYQLTRAIFVRLVGEYNTFRRDALRDDTRTNAPILIGNQRATALRDERLRADFLFSYQPTPGTVVFAGYGSSFLDCETAGYCPPPSRARDLRRTDDAVFVKLSYLFRM
ncbi:MAG TPA: DUF5916 domain-containing protein [Gemmatimonadaceae bacterium]|nr:DUF5916 domain-containing protein [Gemmatimonadaceae bacterium]